jgi:hypothetical protein
MESVNGVSRIELAQNVASCEDTSSYEFWDTTGRSGGGSRTATWCGRPRSTRGLNNARNLRFTGNPDFYKVTTCTVGAEVRQPYGAQLGEENNWHYRHGHRGALLFSVIQVCIFSDGLCPLCEKHRKVHRKHAAVTPASLPETLSQHAETQPDLINLKYTHLSFLNIRTRAHTHTHTNCNL